MSHDKNDIAFWFPRLAAAHVPVPRTEMVTTDLYLDGLLDNDPPALFNIFTDALADAARKVGRGPWFLRTGQGSGKHAWDKTCYVTDLSHVGRHVAALVEWSAEVDFLGLPTRTWAVREFLKLQVAFHAFRGRMPIAREYRAFMVDGRLQCLHPYWPQGSIYRADVTDWRERLDGISTVTPGVRLIAESIVHEVAPHFDGTGDWSLDICPTVDGTWTVTDMAVAERSFHWAECEFCPVDQRTPEPTDAEREEAARNILHPIAGSMFG